MPPSIKYCSYALHTDHKLDTRSWIIAHPELGDNLWSSKRTLDDVNGEIVERITARTMQYCEIHMPVKGWYLLITSPSRAFRSAQKQASHPHASSHGQGKSYVNLVPSRPSSSSQVGAGGSIEFKFHLVHAASSTSSTEHARKERKRRSHVVVETDSDAPKKSDDAEQGRDGPKGWTRFANDQSENTSSTPSPSLNPFPSSSHPAESPSIQPQMRTSTFILRPINHSIAKSHVASLNISHSSSSSSASASNKNGHHSHSKEHNRMSLRGLAGLFSATDNSFELIWENEESEKDTPILIFEDRPSLLRTETKGQFHLLKSLILEEFQIPAGIVMQGQQQQQEQGQRAGEAQKEGFDPLTFFVSVGIAYLGFLEDQEAYKAASQG